ncbi:MAG: hypothetical protein ACE5EH_06095 [Gammaproteobacteria bacterium]
MANRSANKKIDFHHPGIYTSLNNKISRLPFAGTIQACSSGSAALSYVSGIFDKYINREHLSKILDRKHQQDLSKTQLGEFAVYYLGAENYGRKTYKNKGVAITTTTCSITKNDHYIVILESFHSKIRYYCPIHQKEITATKRSLGLKYSNGILENWAVRFRTF